MHSTKWFFAVGVVIGVLAACVPAAPVPCTSCGDVCVDLQTDSAHCGTCTNACAAGTRCEAGACVKTVAPCAAGFQDKDHDGTCAPACTDTTCANGGTCADTTGAAVCSCPTGYAGPSCALCAPGYQDNDGNGSCTASCKTAVLGCVNGGVCTDVSGTATCACPSNTTGAACATCATGFQDKDNNGTCLADCSSAGCKNGGTCSDTTGTAVCTCATGYAGPQCAQCAVGYQDNDHDAVCKPSCSTAPPGCSNGGSCSDSTGTPSCICPAGYAGSTCASCASGYQDDDGNGKCAAACTTAAAPPALGLPRVMLSVPNAGTQPLSVGDLVAVAVPPSIASSWIVPLSDGGVGDGGLPDAGFATSLVFHFGDGGAVAVPRTFVFNTTDAGTDTTVVFALAQPIAPGATSTAYGLYRSSASAQQLTQPLPALPFAGQLPISSLACDVKTAFFFSLQLRLVSPGLYEVNVGDGTGDPGSLAHLVVTDLTTGAIIKDKSWGDGAGSCCTAPTLIATERFAITAPLFKVRMETREFSGSHRFFGCADYGTGNPPTSQLGVTELVYTADPEAIFTGSICGL